jgi:hypothetical protein
MLLKLVATYGVLSVSISRGTKEKRRYEPILGHRKRLAQQ